MNKYSIAIASLVMVVFGLSIAAAQEEAKLSANASITIASNRKEILAEIKKLDGHDWAGVYYAGDGMGENTSLAIAPESGYVFQWRGCLGLYDQNYGVVNWKDGQLRLSFTFENERKGFRGIAPELIPVSWGSRIYLIPTDDCVGFCNEINQGKEPRNISHGNYFLRLEDEKFAVNGFPKLPEEFRSYLLATPIEATVVAVSPFSTRPRVADWKFKDTPVTLDVGSKQGLRVGMELLVTKPKHKLESMQVTKVEEMRSEAIMTQIEESEPGPEVGWKLSTQAPWRVQRKK
jgi:hypothetical protein